MPTFDPPPAAFGAIRPDTNDTVEFHWEHGERHLAGGRALED
jgi:hypothetical protein